MTEYTDPPAANNHGTFVFDGVTFDVQLQNYVHEPFMFNVTDPTYGALGDDINNDTAAIQAAHDAAAAVHGTVFVPPGTYKITASIVYDPTVSIVGAGSGYSILKGYNLANGVLFHNTPAAIVQAGGVIRDLSIIDNNSGIGLNWVGVYNFAVQRVKFASCGTAVKLRGCLIGKFDQCTFTNNATGIDADSATVNGSVYYANLVKILDSRIVYNSSFAVHWVGGGLTLDGCDIEVNGTNGNAATGSVYFQLDAEDETTGLVMNGCWFEVTNGGSTVYIDAPVAAVPVFPRHSMRDCVFQYAINSTYGIQVIGTAKTNTLVCDGVAFKANPANAFYADGVNAAFYLNQCYGQTGGTGAFHVAQYS